MKSLYASVICLVCFSVGCGVLSSGPSKTLTTFSKCLEEGKIDDAAKLFSTRVISGQGLGNLKSIVATGAPQIKAKGGISSQNIQKEDIIGDVAEVTLEVKYINGETEVTTYKLIKENDEWKIDGVIDNRPWINR